MIHAIQGVLLTLEPYERDIRVYDFPDFTEAIPQMLLIEWGLQHALEKIRHSYLLGMTSHALR